MRKRKATKVTIIEARITKLPASLFDPMPQVYVKYSNRPMFDVFLFEYYPDEISFTSAEFLGLTREQAITLKFNKDKRYLQS